MTYAGEPLVWYAAFEPDGDRSMETMNVALERAQRPETKNVKRERFEFGPTSETSVTW